MQANEVTPEHVRRLARSRPRGGKVLSVYVNLDPQSFAAPPARATAITSVLDEAERELRAAHDDLDHQAREGLKSGIDRARRFFEQDFDAEGAQGVALFTDSGQELFEALKLPRPVDQRAVIDDTPYIEPLAALDSGARFLVILCNRRTGRLLVGGPDGLQELWSTESTVHGQHSQGGWSQRRYEESVDNEAMHHVRRVAEEAERRFGGQPLDGVLVGAPVGTLGRLEDELSGTLRERLIGRIDIDVENTSPDDVLAAARERLDQARREREDEDLAKLAEGLSGGPSPAAAGLVDVAGALNEQRVGTLLLGAG